MTTIVIMPGGFHPFHAGHYALYQSAQRTFPDADVYVAATDDVTTRPFPFQVKEKLAQLAGVNKGRFMRVKSPFKAEEITAPYNPAKDTLIFVRSEKDSTKPPQPGGVKKDGSPSYLQPLLGAKKLEPFAKHAYMAYLPTVEFGPGMTSATEIRTAWPQLNDKRKTALVMSLYPRTQGNAKLAATVVGLLDAAMGTELNEFAPGSGGGDSGRWYTDDQMTDIVGDGWWEDMDVSGNISKQQMIQQAQAWLDDQGYSVQVLNAKLNDDDMDWFIQGSFHNPGFAKKGVAETINTAVLNKRFRHTQEIGDYTYKASSEYEESHDKVFLYIRAYDGTKQIGETMFEIWDFDDEPSIDHLESGGTEVDPAYRNKGIASTMYAYAKMLGNDIRPSDNQRPDGKAMWAAWQKSGAAKHLTGVAEGAPIVVAQAPIDVRNPKKAPQPYRNKGDIVPDTTPPSTEKRGVKGRAGQRPMPKYDENNDYLDE